MAMVVTEEKEQERDEVKELAQAVEEEKGKR